MIILSTTVRHHWSQSVFLTNRLKLNHHCRVHQHCREEIFNWITVDSVVVPDFGPSNRYQGSKPEVEDPGKRVDSLELDGRMFEVDDL